MNGKISIQIQDTSGLWRTVAKVINQSQVINKALQTNARIHKKTTQAVDGDGNLVNIHPFIKEDNA
jgi:hypothetical protein